KNCSNVNSLAPGVVESAVLNEGGFTWKACIRPNAKMIGLSEFVLKCKKYNWKEWKCEVNIGIKLHIGHLKIHHCDLGSEMNVVFDEDNND
ncbi:hypothetical protein PMAYCL1PPCAC_25585, partial [Pristionchus mayeri]